MKFQNVILFFGLLFLSLVFLGVELAEASRFEKIGGGVSGSSQEKIEVLQLISLIAGNFFIFLGIVALLTRNRFEGFIGMYQKKKGEAVTRVPQGLIIFGSILILLYYL